MCVPAYVTMRNVDVCGWTAAVGVATAEGEGTDCHEPDMLLLSASGDAYPDVAAASDARVDVTAVPRGALSSSAFNPSVAIFLVADIMGGLVMVGARVAVPAAGGEAICGTLLELLGLRGPPNHEVIPPPEAFVTDVLRSPFLADGGGFHAEAPTIRTSLYEIYTSIWAKYMA